MKGKYIVMCIIGILCFSTTKSQCCYSCDSILYNKAYNYVITDSLFFGKPINVSNKLTGTSYVWFVEEIVGNKDSNSRFMEFLELDEKYSSNDFLCSNIVHLFKKFPHPHSTLFFSKIINNDMFVGVRISNFSSPFGDSVLYYFIFDSDGNIEYVHKKELCGL